MTDRAIEERKRMDGRLRPYDVGNFWTGVETFRGGGRECQQKVSLPCIV